MKTTFFTETLNLISRLFILFLVMGSYVLVHEATHIAVANTFGCESTFKAFNHVTTECKQITDAHLVSQSNVDLVGYQFFWVVVVFTVYGLFKRGD